MPGETTTATPNWTALQGRILDGGYEVDECLLANPASASFKVRVLGDRFTQAVVNVFTAEAAPIEQCALWQEAVELRHPNISTPITVGRLHWDGDSYPYVILHKADENLAAVLGERALTPIEARELLRSVGAGLEHLHANGFVHSVLSPEHILAMGDAIRLSSTSIRRINTPLEDGETEAAYKAPESGAENLTTAADVWCLGATLFEVLTQKKYAENCLEDARALPAPFDWIVERCLNAESHERATLSEVFAILSGESTRPAPKPEPAPLAMAAGTEARAPSATANPQTAPAKPLDGPRPPVSANPNPRTLPRPVESPRPKLAPSPKPVYTENRPRLPTFPEEKPQESPRIKFLSYTFLAIVLAGGLLWLARPKPEKARPTVNPVAHTQTSPTPGSETRTVQPDGTMTGATGHPGAVSGSSGPAGKNEIWRVVVLTFVRREDAEKQAQSLGQTHPGFSPEVFSRDANGPFLVVLGGPMTRDQAVRMRQRARSSGFPRDSYVQNFDH
jgi:eukaryotic-like serine/threonine-protein kinase